MTQKQVITQKSDVLLFGKYKYCTIQHVLQVDPSYILWLEFERVVKLPKEILFDAEDRIDAENDINDSFSLGYSYHDDD